MLRIPVRLRAALAGGLLLLAGAATASAHALNTSYFLLTDDGRQLTVELRLHLDDLVRLFPVDRNGDGRLAPEEFPGTAGPVEAFVADATTLEVNGRPVALDKTTGIPMLLEDGAGQEFLAFRYAIPHAGALEQVRLRLRWFERFGADYTALLQCTTPAGLQQAVLSVNEPETTLTLAAPRSLWRQAGDYLALGIKHIFLGYDHLLFLAALIIIGGRLRDLATTVTAFTLAHSLTLILAALQVVTLPSRLIESGIALSIVYVATENLLRPHPSHRWRLTFGFGLVHGFGFASVLRELGLPRQGLIASLLAFNGGVEIGQLAVVSALWPVVGWVNRRPQRRAIIIAWSSLVLLCGLGWFLERAFRLRLMPF